MSTNPHPRNPHHRCRVELDLAALRTNLDRLRDALGRDALGRDALGGDAPIIAMVKADAYGLGTRHVVPVLQEAGVRCFGVASTAEARALREEGVRDRVVVFGPFAPGMERGVVEAGAEASVSDMGTIERFAEFAAASGADPVPLHVEIDTGMGRAGLPATEVPEWAPPVRAALALPGVRWAGVFTHLHSADAPGHPGVADQVEAFLRAVDEMDTPPEVERHVANSAGAFLDAVPRGLGARPGIYLYGGAVPGAPAPEPVVALRATIVRVVDVPAGATVGYGATHRAASAARWATAAIGYGDGLPRALSNRGRALVHGRPAPIVGRVSMDLTVLDVTGRDDVRPGDDATFLGAEGLGMDGPGAAGLGSAGLAADGPGAESTRLIPLEELAEHAGTISYEILTRLAARVPRIVVSGTRHR